MAVNVNISSDILQQALENSGLTASVQQNGSTAAAAAAAAAARRITGVTSTMTIHDSATGTVKKHIIRNVIRKFAILEYKKWVGEKHI